jgi:alkaline phosphatase
MFQTYNCDSQTSDSASTATALFSGIKTNINTLGFDNLIEYDDPTSELRANKVETILTWAQNAGMDTGKQKSTLVQYLRVNRDSRWHVL